MFLGVVKERLGCYLDGESFVCDALLAICIHLDHCCCDIDRMVVVRRSVSFYGGLKVNVVSMNRTQVKPQEDTFTSLPVSSELIHVRRIHRKKCWLLDFR